MNTCDWKVLGDAIDNFQSACGAGVFHAISRFVIMTFLNKELKPEQLDKTQTFPILNFKDENLWKVSFVFQLVFQKMH